MSRWLKWFMAVTLLILMGAGGFVAGKYYWQREGKGEKKTATSSAKSTGSKSAANKQAAEGQEGCWKEYKNQPVGYSLKYPCDWQLKEVNDFSETIGLNVKYIIITTPDNKYFLHFGVRKSGVTSFETTDRTGIGVGEFVQKPNQVVKIFGINVIPKALVFEGKIKEYFYDQPTGTDATCGCNFTANFSYTEEADYETYDLVKLDYPNTVKLILQSTTLL